MPSCIYRIFHQIPSEEEKIYFVFLIKNRFYYKHFEQYRNLELTCKSIYKCEKGSPTYHEFFIDDHLTDDGVNNTLVNLKHLGQRLETQ